MAGALDDDYDWDLNIKSAVGIDLGTTFSCVSVYKDGRITIIRDEHEVKRLMGRKFDEKAVQTNIKRWPYLVTANSHGNAQVNLHLDGQSPINFSPEEISSSILVKLKQMAEKHLDEKVTEAVITVPAHFNNSQREATMKAAELAKLKVLAIINEPNAAALAYGIRSKVKRKRKFLVMDVGGGTSDVALIEVAEENFSVLACKGDNNVGGEDFNTNLLHYCVEQIKAKIGSDIKIGKLQMRRLRNKCEQAKRKLSENPSDLDWYYELELDDFIDGAHDLTLSISRNKFEELNQDLFEKAIGLVTCCMNDAKLSVSDVNDIVPVGGSMRIPKLREMLQEQFKGRQLYAYINTDEAVAVGAAIFAAQKLGLYSGHIVLTDITPFSLGQRISRTIGSTIEKGVMSVIIPKHTKIPCEGQHRYHTIKDNQKNMGIKIYQGENEYVKDNMFLGSFKIKNLTPALKGETKIDVFFEVDTNGILKVTAKEVSTEKENVETRELDTLILHLNLLNVSQSE